MKRLILSMLTCVTLTASTAVSFASSAVYSPYASCIKSPFSVALSGGLMKLKSKTGMSYGVNFDPTNTGLNAADTVVGGNPVFIFMTDNGLNDRESLSFGYTKIGMGVGGNLELTYNTFDIKGSVYNRSGTFAANMISLFLNFDYHSVAGHSIGSNVGLYTSFGFGVIEFSDAKGSFQFDVNRTASTAIVATNSAEASFDDCRGLTLGSNIKLGVEGIISSNFVLGVNAVFGMTFGDIALKGGAANLPPLEGVLHVHAYPAVYDMYGGLDRPRRPEIPAVPSAKFLQSVNVVMPAIYYGVAEIRASYFMG